MGLKDAEADPRKQEALENAHGDIYKTSLYLLKNFPIFHNQRIENVLDDDVRKDLKSSGVWDSDLQKPFSFVSTGVEKDGIVHTVNFTWIGNGRTKGPSHIVIDIQKPLKDTVGISHTYYVMEQHAGEVLIPRENPSLRLGNFKRERGEFDIYMKIWPFVNRARSNYPTLINPSL